ncbi:TonB-dependent receptor domain-containing protein, partial [Bacteroidota bacterium]
MNFKIVFFYLLLSVIGLHTYGANLKGVVKENSEEKKTVFGASIYWLGTTVGTITDSEGRFEIKRSGDSDLLVVSYVGYISDTIKIGINQKEVVVLLKANLEIDEVTVTGRAAGSHLSRIDPINTVKITGAELCKAACCNLSESFETNPSVDVSYTDAATGAKQIKMLGLSGKYVQMITENIPSMRGLAQAYGLGYIPGSWMESIQVSKGTSSVINGYEAVTGQINVEYKKPTTSEHLFVNVLANDAGKREANINASAHLNERLTTMILAHAEDMPVKNDNNGDGFLDMPLLRQYNFINRWNYEVPNKYIGQLGVKLLDESRRAGQVNYFDDNDGDSYGIDIDTKRVELFLKNGFIFNPETGKSLGIILSDSYHKQNSFFGNRIYDADQHSFYSNVIFQNQIKNPKHQYSTGISYMFDRYNEQFTDTLMKRDEGVIGAFFQYTYNLDDRLIALVGMRLDHHNKYGLFFTPRFHLKYNISDYLHLRGSIGKGYRSANVIAENNFLLASSRDIFIDKDLDQEESLNFGFNITGYIPIIGNELTISTDYYRTNFINQVVLDMDSDVHKVFFHNLDGKSFSSCFQLQASYELFRGLDITSAFRFTDVKTTINGVLRDAPLNSRYKGLITMSYQTPLKKWQIDLTSQFNGGGRMPDPDPVNPLWDTEYPSFTKFNTQITKYFRTWSIYLGVENITNYKMDNPVIDAVNPLGPNFDASMAWGP